MSDSDSDGDSTPNATLATTRTRRDNAGKRKAPANKFAALQKLKEARQQGRKMNYEVEEVQNVYDIVDESEYAEEVSKKRDEDWIVDDDGGYIEDGREIFDEELDDVGSDTKTKSKERGEKNKKEGVRSSNIKNMLLNMPSKKQVEDAKLDEDALLGDILGQIKTKSSTGIKKVVKATTPSATSERNPFVKKGTGLKKVSINRPTPSMNGSGEAMEAQETVTESQNVEEFATQDLEGFDEEMDINDFDEDMEEEKVVPEITNPELESNKGRGFASLAEGSSVGEGQWFSSGSSEQQVVQEVAVDNSTLPILKSDSGEDVLRMYWLDAHEDPFKHPGTVWLFGKVWVDQANSWVSCCVTVRNIPRRVYLAKRDFYTNTKTKEVNQDKPVNTMDLYNEFNDKIAKRYKINEHKCRPVEKMYAFEHADIPDLGQYLEVLYSSQYPALPPDLDGETFSKVFGAPQTSLEWFLLEQKIKGPGWLDIKLAIPSSPPVSWCKLEASVTDPSYVMVSPCTDDIPPLTILSIKLGSVINSKTQQNEVAMVGCLAHTKFSISSPMKELYNQHFCLVTKPVDEAWPYDWAKVAPKVASITKVEKANSERELLSLLLLKIQKMDPDVIIGHDVSSFDLEVLIHRMVLNKIAHWSRLGRLRRSNQPGSKNKFLEKQAMVGRLVADLKISAKELIRCKSYELGALVEKCLKDDKTTDETRPKLTPDTLRKSYSSSDELMSAIKMCMRDADQTLQLMVQLQALPLALQISQIVGTVFSRTLRGGRAERIEFLLLHAFTHLGYIVPDKQFGKRKENEDEDSEAAPKGRKKPSYAGGLVLEPKKGFYDKFILLLDFNSLYPSIIQEYNICFTTVDRSKKEKTADGEMILPPLPDASLPAGVLPTQIKKLVDSRREVKNILKKDKLTETQKAQLNIRQLGLKLTANSMYGCLGFSFSRFFAKHLAALVTSKGREILLQTRDLIQKMNLDVIYGDTDSVMVNTNSNDYDEVFKLGREVKEAVNKLYRLLELDIDGVYKYMLLLKKKKYAAMTVEKDKDGIMRQSTELKGLDIVRRDWSQLAADAGKQIIDILMTDKAEDARLSEIQDHLEGLKTSLLDGKVSLRELEITKQLTKDPSDYPDKKSLPHVQVAMRVNSSGGKKLRAGDTVQYVICEDGSGLAATQRAYHVEEVRDSDTLKIDTQYYLAQQLHPVVSRLCDPIEGMDGARIAQCLGLDPSQYKQRVERSDEQVDGVMREEDRFRGCERLVVECACGDMLTVDSPVRGSGKDAYPALLCCPKVKDCGGCPMQLEGKLVNAVDMLTRKMINKYYAGWLVCEDPGCVGRTRVLPLQFQRAYPVCGTCTKATMYREYNDSQLYTQMQFITYLLDTKRMLEQADDQQALSVRIRSSDKVGNPILMYAALKQRVEQKFLKYNGYATVSLNKIFEGLFPIQQTSPAQA